MTFDGNTEVLVHAEGQLGLEKVKSWLEYASIPSVRPLYSIFCQHYDYSLRDAALVKSTEPNGAVCYTLVLLQDIYLKHFNVVGRLDQIEFKRN